MVSLSRYIRHIRQTGVKEWWRMMQYIGDAKSGRMVGADAFGNRYFENLNGEEEVPGRHRWVDYSQHDFNASQIPSEWHSWLTHIRKDPPTEDPVVKNVTPPWKGRYLENMTGTRGSYRSYNTAGPTITAWEPKVAQRS
ncbi:NDUFA12-domain-containing protein [Schizopora paradoxa]|uniref:NADH dehydrogenase [ubiquinone] 1 alpha subcomplex subunit n=1 Tax=Schizopora paradoxa TaxID=27342 RepID=A0A0H2S3R2_9AGAM|nr:NDUFA12-domain-containing protein [Schizopora paradoxa]